MNKGRGGKYETNKKSNKQNRSRGADKFSKGNDKYAKQEGKGQFGNSNRLCDTNNSPDWYSSNPALLAAAASFSYTWPTGNAVDLGPYASKIHLGSVPGIMAIYIDPQVGWADNQNSPITLASREEYAYVRYANAGHANYDPADLLLYHVAMDSCYSFFSFLKRLYGICRTYSNVNRYYPKAIVEAMNVDFDDIMKHLADLNYSINVFATMFSRLNVPAGMSYVTKHMWMYENIYTDANTPRGQTYMFVPRSLFKYAYDENQAGKLERVILDPNYGSTAKPAMTYEDLINLMNSLLNPVIADEDIGIMSGDILKAYGDSGIMKLSGVDFAFGVAPVYNTEVLEIINNITLLGPSFGDITQDVSIGGGWIKSTPEFEHSDDSLAADMTPGMNALVSDRFINFRRDNITPADSMVVTRLMNIAIPGSYNYSTHRFSCDTIGSETAAFARIFWYGRTTAQDPWELKWTKPFTMSICFSIAALDDVGRAEEYLARNNTAEAQLAITAAARELAERISYHSKFVELVSQFDYHPALGLSSYANLEAASFDWDSTTETRAVSGIFYDSINGFVFDLANYAIVGRSELKNLSEVALLNMFHLGMGRTNV